ncbi:MAG: ATP-binding protein [Acidimicrobiales bacterium]|nr:ATP-binding protein [Acidimicrobiales bacterium]MYD35091.1 ATP-binding protein [Acidimicrobiales bacterium]MYI08683.1 ATP-binding protein [Acidimicrobiales bacterium]
MAVLASVVDSCVPRPDVLGGGLVDKHFAAQLDQVIRGSVGYHDYADPDSFFKITHPTKGLRELLAGTFARLSGNASAAPSAEHAVYRYETSFGGGKTHGLIALWHLASGARPSDLDEFINPALLPDECAVAAVVGDSLDPINGLTTDDTTTFTMWGEIARQLGPDAWAAARESDEARTAIGKQVWLDIIGDRPTVIVIDEIAQHLRLLATSGHKQSRDLAEQTIAGLKVLFEAATAAPRARIIVTLATGTDAFETETAEVAKALREAEVEQLLSEAHDVMERPKGAVGRPAEDDEIGFILRRRLFAEVDENAASTAAQAYRDLYATLADQGVAVGGSATDDPAGYAERLRSAYPFHPALIDCLDKRIGPMPGFQRARGALKMLAETVAALWRADASTPIINLGDLPLDNLTVRSAITTSIGREALDGPAVADFAASTSHAALVDNERWPAERLATRACRAAFCNSVASGTQPGASSPDLYAGTLAPGETPEAVDAALEATSLVAWHLTYDGARWRFQVEPNANRIIASELSNVPNADITEELDRRIRRLFASDGPTKAVHFPTGPADVPDAEQLHLVVFSHEDLTVRAATAGEIPTQVVDVAHRYGTNEQSRTNRNAVVALVADADEVEPMRDRIRFELAAQRITTDSDRLGQFDAQVAKTLRNLTNNAALESRIGITRAYTHLYWPENAPGNNYLRHLQLSYSDYGKTPNGSHTPVIVEALRSHGKITDTPPPTDLLADASGFGKVRTEITTAELAAMPWRGHRQKIVLNPTLLTQAIAAGVRNGTWVYYDQEAEKAWGPDDPPPNVRTAANTLLYTPARAAELNLLRKRADWSAISTIVTADAGPFDGASLRRELTTTLGGEPPKAEVLSALATAVRDGQRIAASLTAPTAETTPQQLAATEIEGAELDALYLWVPADSTQPPPKELRRITVEGETAGTALGKLRDAVADSDISEIAALTVTASAEAGRGTANLRTLGYCASQLPRFECGITASLQAEFDGLAGGITADLAGGIADWRHIEQTLLALADLGSAVGGSFTMRLTPPAPIAVDSNDWEQFRSVVANNNPVALRIEAEPAGSASSGGEQ